MPKCPEGFLAKGMFEMLDYEPRAEYYCGVSQLWHGTYEGYSIGVKPMMAQVVTRRVVPARGHGSTRLWGVQEQCAYIT